MIEIPKPIQPAYLREVIRDQHIVTPSKMPFVWTSLDTRNAIIASIVPTSIGIAHILSSRPHQPYFRFLESANKPKWGDFPPWLCGAIDFLTIAPLGYASYLIYKNGGGFDYIDTSFALGLYGTNMLFAGANIFFFEKRNYKIQTFNKMITMLTAIATTYCFYKIDTKAGWCYLPFVFGSIGSTFYFYKLAQLNDPTFDKQEL